MAFFLILCINLISCLKFSRLLLYFLRTVKDSEISTFGSGNDLDDNLFFRKVVVPNMSGTIGVQDLIESDSVVVHFFD